MATCRDLYLKEIKERLGIVKADEARKACEFLSYCDRASSSIWYGKDGDLMRLKYNKANQVLSDINEKMREV